MLGDIHGRQPLVLDANGKVKVAYSGSLIQQNFGESTEKGFLLWDLDQNRCTFIQVVNEWGFKTFRLDEEAINNIENIEFDLPASLMFAFFSVLMTIMLLHQNILNL